MDIAGKAQDGCTGKKTQFRQTVPIPFPITLLIECKKVSANLTGGLETSKNNRNFTSGYFLFILLEVVAYARINVLGFIALQ